MNQLSLTDMEYANRKRKTKREIFLETMNEVIPWSEWVGLIEPHYPLGERGRPPRGILTMLKMYLLQNWFNLSDEGVEDEIYDSYAMRAFMGLNFMKEQVPDATTLLNFRHLLEEHNLGEAMFKNVTDLLEAEGKLLRGGSIVDATIITAPTSTKNKENKRDVEMASTRKGNQWYFGMKVHSGVDAYSGYVHSLVYTAANAHDITQAHKLIREDDDVMYGDSGYLGMEKRDEVKNNAHLKRVIYKVNLRHGAVKKMKDAGDVLGVAIEKAKSSVRFKVEHPFHIVKNTFGYRKARYRGIDKNANKFNVLFACANLLTYARTKKKQLAMS
jgi:IS5 family transposase